MILSGTKQAQLRQLCGDDPSYTAAALQILQGDATPDWLEENFEACEHRVRECYHPPDPADLELTALNSLTNGYGVESLGASLGRFNPHALDYAPQYSYINQGDTYNLTIIRDNATGRYILSDIGTLIESGKVKEEAF